MNAFIKPAVRLSLAVIAATGMLTSVSHAQTFHENDWVFVSSVHPFPYRHMRLKKSYANSPNDFTKFYPFIASNAYPGTLSGPGIWCYESKEIGVRDEVQNTPHFTVSTSTVDELLKRLKSHAKWMVSKGQSFEPVQTYATGPRYAFEKKIRFDVLKIDYFNYTLTPVGDQVNYVGCEPDLNFMAVNSQHSMKGSNFMTIGENVDELLNMPMLLDLMPMHELIHVHQNNHAPYKLAKLDLNRTGLSWLIEGTADAVGMHRVHTLHGGHKAVLRKIGPYSNKFYRRFYMLRNYNIPLGFEMANGDLDGLEDLAVLSAIDKKMMGALGYETNGFWFHIIERYLRKDAGKFTDLFDRLDTLSTQNTTRQVDNFLDKHDGKTLKGLEHVYPQFLAEFTNWWEVRTAKKISEEKWLKIAYSGCAKFDLTTSKTHEMKSLDISDYAAKCVDIKIDSEAAQRLNDVQFVVAGANQSSDDIYLAMSRIVGTKRGTTTCFDIVESRGISTAPCLMDPHQGFANWKGGAATPQRTLLRTFNVTDLQGVNGQAISLRLVVVRVPAKHYDVVGKLNRKKLDLTISLDLASLKPKSGSKPKKHAVMKYSARQGEGPVSPDGDTSIFDATLDDALRGNVATFGVPGLKSQALNQLIEVELIDDDDTNFAVGFFLQETLKVGVTGPVKVIGVLGERKINGSQVVSYQDPDYESTLEILENDEATLRIRGQVNVCAGPLSALLNEKADLCKTGDRLSYSIESAVAFPTLVNGESDFSLYSTPSYEAYKDLRMARMGMGPRQGSNSGSPNQVGGRSGNAGGTPGPVCSVIAPTGSCDCSCEAKTCFGRKTVNQSIRPQEKACRLTCGKRWKSCPVTGPTP